MHRSRLSKQGGKVGNKKFISGVGGGDGLLQNHRDVKSMFLDSTLLEHKASKKGSGERYG